MTDDPKGPESVKLTPQAVLFVLAFGVAVFVLALVLTQATDTKPAARPAPATPAPASKPLPEPETVLVVEVDGCGSGEDYTRTEGLVRNDGETVVHFVQVELRYEDAAGRVIDTGTTYAVGSERLAPGESSRFEGFSRASGVHRCSARLETWRLVTD